MKMGDFKTMAGGFAVAALVFAVSTAPVAAQTSDECRCVDRAGNAIENCSCFRAPRIQGLVQSFGFTDSRPRLGISVDARQSARRDAVGALVTDVLEGGPADAVGIRRGDVITAIDGQSLFEPMPGDAEEAFDLDRSVPVQRLLAIAAELEPGQEVEVEYRRGEDERSTMVEADDLSDSWGSNFSVAMPAWNSDRFREQLRGLTDGLRVLEFRSDDLDDLEDRRERIRDREWEHLFEPGRRGDVRVFGRGDAPGLIVDRYRGGGYGLELVALNPDLGSYFGTEEGVLVADVDEDSTLGLRPGDVVLRVGERAVTTPDRLRRILRSYGADEDITFQVRRDGRETTVTGSTGG